MAPEGWAVVERVLLRDREGWRYGGDSRLMAALLGDEAIKLRLASPVYKHGRDASRIRLLANAVMVEPELLPNLAVAMERLRAECPEAVQVECFVFSQPEINAFVCRGQNRTIVGLSSAAVNHLDADELMFVLGHEFGHAVFGHLDLCAGQLAEDPAVMPAATMRVRSWQRAAEISADRAGVVLAGSLAATLRELCEGAGVVPRTVEEIPHDWSTVLDVNRAVGVQESGQSWSRATTYVPLVEGNRLVGCVTLSESRLKDAPPTTGIVACEPLPYLVRRQFAQRGLSPPYAAAVLHLDSGLVEVLLGPLILAAIVIIALCTMLVDACKSALRRKAADSGTA